MFRVGIRMSITLFFTTITLSTINGVESLKSSVQSRSKRGIIGLPDGEYWEQTVIIDG